MQCPFIIFSTSVFAIVDLKGIVSCCVIAVGRRLLLLSTILALVIVVGSRAQEDEGGEGGRLVVESSRSCRLGANVVPIENDLSNIAVPDQRFERIHIRVEGTI